MASLQSYKGSGKNSGKTLYRTQPYVNGRRVTIRLGSGQKKANTAIKAISDLIDCQNAGTDDLNASTKAWLEAAAERSLCQLLLKYELISQLPSRFEKQDAELNITTLSELADTYIKTRGAGQSAKTIAIYEKAKRNLVDCFGDIDVTIVQPRDAREFWRWLIEEGSSKGQNNEKVGLGSNTAKQRLRYARGFFEKAVEDGLIQKNPFKVKGLKTTQSAAEKVYVPVEAIEKVIEHCPVPEWKLLFALVRSVPIRMPSEIQEMTWADVDWEENKILIHSPKTRNIGKSARVVPIFLLLRPHLEAAFNDARQNGANGRVREQYVFPTLHRNSNPATTAKKIVIRAKVEPWIGKTWSNFFNSMRASTETDLMDEYGLRRACQWSGNSATTAMKNYALVRKSDFEDVGTSGKADAKSDAIESLDAKSDAVPASTTEQNSHKKSTEERGVALPCIKVGDEGLEPPTSSV